jgi:CRISPR/Cas system CSM-associated protein Csm3 (group 7 of RAMP superfamily)
MTQNTQKIAHKKRETLPLWRIKGSFVLLTPLSIGTGEDVYEDKNEQKEVAIANIALDFAGKPYIPGSAIKGALRALAYKVDADNTVREKIFGHVDGNKTTPSQVEFCNAYGEGEFNKDAQTEDIPHSVRDRNYGTVVDRLLFHEKVVKPGYKFRFECTAQHLDASEIKFILGLLQLAGDQDHGIQLGGGKSGNNGRVKWLPANESVKCFEHTGLAKLWGQVKQKNSTCSDPWSQADTKRIDAVALQKIANDSLELSNLELKFHTPFLVYEKVNKVPGSAGPDGKPRKNHKNQYILPSSSLHGALRSQSEKILRTLGQETPEGYKVPAVMELDGVAKLNHAAILFGAPGWRAVVQCTDFEALPNSSTINHEMLAIDRLTGGGKDGAKFCVQALDCPTLKGSIRIDLGRLRKLEKHNANVLAECLGLLAHVLRDLDEGDIALGYGRAKGYGVSQSNLCKVLDKNIKSKLDLNLKTLLPVFLSRFKSIPAFSVLTSNNGTEPTTTQISNMVAGDFHNPYVFIPLSKPKDTAYVEYSRLREEEYSHSKYNSTQFSGRLICRLRTISPIFIGGSDVVNSQPPVQKNNFKLKGQIAIPATSLRGLFSSLHESISGSSLRVAENKFYSVRASTEEALKYKGLIIKGDYKKPNGEVIKIWKVKDLNSGIEYILPQPVINHLEWLCDERTEQEEKSGNILPKLNPSGVARNSDRAKFGNKLRLVEGQKVYFDINDKKQVIELAYSQIWRKLVKYETNEDGKNVLKPWRTYNGLDNLTAPLTKINSSVRTLISPSELMFGCVEINEKKNNNQNKENILAYATKVRFGYGIAVGSIIKLAPETTLKILASPKPPSPSMYFEHKVNVNNFISKKDLSGAPTKYGLKGRKVYLHALRDTDAKSIKGLDDNGLPNGSRMPWVSHDERKDPKQKVRIKPIDVGNEFFFEVDFSNLTQSELESLCASLVPHSTFEHKIGMGKPIGLGSCKVDLVSMFLIDRAKRYQDTDLEQAQRYSLAWKKDNHLKLPEHLEVEEKTCQTANAIDPVKLAWNQMQKLKSADPSVFNAIVLSGNPNAVKKPVHYPQLPNKNIETETYEWFVKNNNINGGKQQLKPIHASSNAIPALRRQQP